MQSPSQLARRILAAAVLLALFAPPLLAQDPIARGVRLFEQGQYAAARRAIEPYAQSHPRDARAAYYVGLTHLSERDVDRAVEWLERAVVLDGRSADHHLNLGNAYGLKAMRASVIRRALLARKAKTEFEAAVSLAPNSVEARWGLMRFYMLAPGVLGGGRERALEQAGEIRRRNAYAGVYAHAAVYREQDDLAAAARELEAGLRHFPDSVGLYVGLGNTYEQMQRLDASVGVFERLMQRQPQEMTAYYQLARLSVLTGNQMERGAVLLRRYLRHTPRAGEPPLSAAHWRLGMIYEREGKLDQARASYRAALTLDPDFKPAQESLAKLGS
ncbi:MAG TPA: tetratricopeptide repeat protein [Longimicrobium sp.]|jgi:tetratricopeptide (TPR) repeat protein